MNKISAIMAIGENGEVGANGPWPSSVDTNHIDRKGLHHPIVMGRRTYETVGGAIPGHRNFVLSGSGLIDPNVTVCTSVKDVFKALHCHPDEEVFVIGGLSVFGQFWQYVSTFYLTVFHKEYGRANSYLSSDETDLLWWCDIVDMKTGYSPTEDCLKTDYVLRRVEYSVRIDR